MVHQAEVAYRELLGSNRVRLEPGLRLNLPLLHKVWRVDLREQRLPVEVHCYTRENVPVTVMSHVFYRVTDAEAAIFNVAHVSSACASVSASALRAVVGSCEYDYLVRNRVELTRAVEDSVKPTITSWGVALTKIEVQDMTPRSDAVLLQLERQMAAERERRENELLTLAAIRTAEGRKRAAELEAEGKAAAVKLAADAEAYAARVRGEGLALEVGAVAESFDGDVDAAAAYLVKLGQLARLAAIADARNSTVFVPESGVLPLLPTATPSPPPMSPPTPLA